MNIAIIFGGTLIYEMERLNDVLKERGHTVTFIDLSLLSLQEYSAGVWKETMETFDLVYYRSGFGDAGRVLIGRELIDSHTVSVNPVFHLHPLCQNKIYQAGIALRSGIPVPDTYFGKHIDFTELNQQLGVPFILKAAEGIQGAKVHLIHTAEEYAAYLADISGDILFQRLIPNTGDFRILVVGGAVHEIFKRVPPDGSFKANMSLGGSGESVTDAALRAQLSDIALTITRAMHIDIAGIDVIQSQDDGTLFFLEANVNPGWKGLDRTLGTDTAKCIADYFEHRVAEHQHALISSEGR